MALMVAHSTGKVHTGLSPEHIRNVIKRRNTLQSPALPGKPAGTQVHPYRIEAPNGAFSGQGFRAYSTIIAHKWPYKEYLISKNIQKTRTGDLPVRASSFLAESQQIVRADTVILT